jgi:hypothetical protein
MRAHYLWDFAYILRMNANVVDDLKFWDFCNYVNGIDAYRKQMEKNNGG